MEPYCENEYCEAPGFKVVRVSAQKAGDGKRTFCAACENAYTIGVQHGTMRTRKELAKEIATKDKVIRVLQRTLGRIAREAKFSEDDGAMDLGESLLRIESMARAVLPEKGAEGAQAQ